jgi:hypothetical protein
MGMLLGYSGKPRLSPAFVGIWGKRESSSVIIKIWGKTPDYLPLCWDMQENLKYLCSIVTKCLKARIKE